MKKNEITQSDVKALIENEAVYVTNNPKVFNVFSVYLLHEVGETKHYRDVYNLLREANEDDTIIIYINNYGGYISTGQDIINAMRASLAKIITCITGPIYSMAPLIALSGQEIFVEDDVFMMFHDYSGGTEGKGNEIAAQIKHEKPHFDRMFSKICKGFLTEDEIKKICKGEDLYLRREQIIKRLRKIKKLGNGKEAK